MTGELEKRIALSEQVMEKIDKEYAAICQRLGDAILRKEALDLEIGAIRARVQKLRDQKASLIPPFREVKGE